MTITDLITFMISFGVNHSSVSSYIAKLKRDSIIVESSMHGDYKFSIVLYPAH